MPAHRPHSADITCVAPAIRRIVHEHELAGDQRAVVAIVMHVPNIVAAGNDRPIAAAASAVELKYIVGDGSQLAFDDAWRGAADGFSDGERREPACVPHHL